MLFRKALHMVEGVVTDMGAEKGLIDQVLLSEFVLHFCAEWPWRFLRPPDSHAFATRVSTADLAELVSSIPWRAIRYLTCTVTRQCKSSTGWPSRESSTSVRPDPRWRLGGKLRETR